MQLHRQILRAGWLLQAICIASGSVALAESEQAGDRSVVQQIEGTVKKVGDKIEQGFTKAAKKIEGKHLGEKVERKVKKAFTKTEEGFKKAAEKIKQKLGS
jgi:microcompartment protein CcmL/EutN